MLVYRMVSPEKKSYIGFTEKTLERRMDQHKNDASRFDYDLHLALRKYPIEKWNIEVLEECVSRKDLEARERYYIQKFDSFRNGYNMTLGGDGMDSKTASKKRKEYFKTDKGKEWKKVLSKKWKENNPGDFTGKHHSEETKKKISKANTGRTHTDTQKKAHSKEMKKRWKAGVYADRPPQTQEHIQKRADGRRGKGQTRYQKDVVSKLMEKEWIVTFPDGHEENIVNLRQFCFEHNLDSGNLQRTQPGGNQRQHKGFKVRKP